MAYLAHLPEHKERPLKSFKSVFTHNAFCWAAMEDVVFAGTFYSIVNLNIWNLKTRHFNQIERWENMLIYTVLISFLPAVEQAVHPGPPGSSRRGWCPHRCWSWNRRSPWWNLLVCSARLRCCSCICRVCHYPAVVRHSHLKKHKDFMLWHIRHLLISGQSHV